MPLYITAAADYVERIADDVAPADLKPLVAEAVGAPVRRIGRFIQLALIGAGRCARATQLPRDTGVYLGSGRGDLEVTVEVMQTLLRDGHPPKPLSFINTVSNAACYYVAQNLKLMGRSSFVCNRYFAFESVLQLAALDLQAGLKSALIGTVDVVVPPLAGHRIRLGLALDAAVADATHWIELRAERTASTLAQISAAEHFVDEAALTSWLEQQHIDCNGLLATGQFMPASEAKSWSEKLKLEKFEYRSDLAYYDSQSGAVIGEYLRSAEQRELLHINRDPGGRYSVMVLGKET